jgi:hypothetical protein
MDNSVLLTLIIVLMIAVVYAGMQKSSKRLVTILVVLLTIMLICYFQLRSEPFNGYAPVDYLMGRIAGNSGNVDSVDGYRYADINQNISPLNNYDGLVLKSKLVTKSLISKPVIFSPVGDGVILTEDPASKNFPTVDGQLGSPKHLFTFANNQVSWDCCGSSNITSDGLGGKGCVCYSPNQIRMFQGRGMNKTNPVEYPEM